MSFVCEQPSSLVQSMQHIVQRSSASCYEFASLRNWDVDGRVSLLKQWNIHRSRRSILFEIPLGGGKSLPLVERHRGWFGLTLWTEICFFVSPNCTCGICSLLSVLCCTTGILHFVHLVCRICLCIVTRSSTLLMNCGWAAQLSSPSVGPLGLVCACLCPLMDSFMGQLRHCDGLF